MQETITSGNVNTQELLSALTGAILAGNRNHIGIRPTNGLTNAAIPLSERGANTQQRIAATMPAAQEKWPTCANWSICGADAIDQQNNWINCSPYASFDWPVRDQPDGFNGD